MTSRRSILLGLALAAFLGAFGLNSVYAQVPRNISYQGLLVKNGQPVNGPVNMQISIYDAAGVTPLYQESMTGVPVTNGIFNVLLGGNAGTLPLSLKFDEAYYLGVNVEGTGELAHTPFSAAPYALNSQTVGGVAVSVTPQPGMLLPLGSNGKFPASVLPQATQSLTTINNLSGDPVTGNIDIAAGNGIIVTNTAPGTITIAATATATGIQTVQAGPGLTGGGSTPTVTLGIAPFGITPGMLGIQSVSGRNLDQNIPQWGLWQDPAGDLNIGIDQTMVFVPAVSNSQVLGMPSRTLPTMNGIGLNLAHTNTWTVVQNFAGGLTGSLGTLGTLGTNANVLTANGLAEPNSNPANSAIAYEIIDNGDLRVTGTTTIIGNTFIGSATNGGVNTMGTPNQSANTITGLTNAINAANGASISTATNNSITAITSGTGVASNTISVSGGATANTNTISAAGGAGTGNTITSTGTNTITAGTTNTLTATTSNNLTSQTNNVGAAQTAGGVNNVGTGATGANTNNIGTTTNSTNNIQGTANNVGTTQSLGGTNIIGTASNSLNVMTGQTNTLTGSVSNSIQAPTNNVGTLAGNTANNIGFAGTSANTMTGATNQLTATNTNTLTATTSNNLVSQNNNIGTTQVAGGANTIGTAGISTTTIHSNVNIGSGSSSPSNIITIGSAANNTATTIAGLTATVNATTNNIGTNAASTNNIGSLTSTNTVNGTTTFNGIHNINGATTINGSLSQSNGLVALAGAAGANSFGSALGANNTIGNATNSINVVQGATNTLQGGTNNLLGTTNNVNAATNNMGTVTGQANNIGTGGSSTNTIGVGGSGTNSIQAGTNNIGTVGASSNTIGTAGSSTNVINGSSNTINGPLQVNGTTSTTGNLTLGTTSTTNTYGAAGSANRFNGTSNFGTLPASNGNKLIVDGVVTPGVLTSGDYEEVVNGDLQVTGTASIANLIIPGGLFCVSNLQVGTLSPNCAAPASAITLADALSQTTLNGFAANTFLATNFTGLVNHAANITQTVGSAQFLNTQVNGTLGSTGNLLLATVSSSNFIGTAGSGSTTIQGNSLALNASGAAAVNSINANGAGASNAITAIGVGSNNTLTAPNNNLNGILTQTGNATFTGGNTTFNADNINGNNNSAISNFTTIQTNLSMTVGVPGTNATTVSSSNAGPATINQQLPSVAGRIPTIQIVLANLLPATGLNGGGAVNITSGVTLGTNGQPVVFDGNSAWIITYTTHNTNVAQGLTSAAFGVPGPGQEQIESSWAGDNNQVQITILRP